MADSQARIAEAHARIAETGEKKPIVFVVVAEIIKNFD